MSNNPTQPGAREIVNALLDRGYTSQTAALTRARALELRNGVLKARIDELLIEAQRLKDVGEKLTLENPVVRVFLDDLDGVLAKQARLAQSIASDLRGNGAQIARQTFSEITFGAGAQQVASIIPGFNMPSLESILNAIDFVAQDAFNTQLAQVSQQTLDLMKQTILKGFISGKGPLATARELSRLASEYPGYYFNNLMRTLQLESYRNGQLAMEVANERLFSGKVRLAALDDRTCLACIAEHGTLMAVGEKVRDHHQGRCTAVLIVRGREVNVRSGQDWFNSLPEERRRKIAGPANFDALESGKVQLRDYSGSYQDDLFGEMLRANSLLGILGRQAQAFYQQGQ